MNTPSFRSRTRSALAVGAALLVLVVSSAAATAQDRAEAGLRGWGPEQALGPADTHEAGDQPTAWASRTEDDQDEWLVVEFAEAVPATAVRVFESFNPGALSRVTAFDEAGTEVEVWSGKAPSAGSRGRAVTLIPVTQAIYTRRIKLHLVSSRVPGWNEIDAVCLHGADGSFQWAVAAEASSTYAQGASASRSPRAATPPSPLADLEPGARTAADGLLALWLDLRRAGAAEETLKALAREILSVQTSVTTAARRADRRGERPARWLVILEAPWQEGLGERDYSFGAMLRAIFAHVEGVEVRQRFFTDARSFDVYCREIAALDGEVYLVIASHATRDGIYCQQGRIPTEVVARSLARAPNLKVVHFSACEVMAGPLPAQILAARPAEDALEGVSGYTISVDWMASALTEFTYLDLLLNRGLPLERAAEQLTRALDFADGSVQRGSAIPAAHFRLRLKTPPTPPSAPPLAPAAAPAPPSDGEAPAPSGF